MEFHYLSSIELIDPSTGDAYNPLLERLSLRGGATYSSAGFGGIQNIDVSKNVNLTHLTIDTNSLQSLDLSNNPNMVYLDVADNYLSTLNLANGNTANMTFRANNQAQAYTTPLVVTVDPGLAAGYNATNGAGFCIACDSGTTYVE